MSQLEASPWAAPLASLCSQAKESCYEAEIRRCRSRLDPEGEFSILTVRRQSFWDSEGVHLREALARLVADVKRHADDAASVGLRWFVV